MVAHSIVDLFNSFLAEVRPVDCLGVVVGNARELGSASNGTSLLVDESDELESLVVGDLHVLPDHLIFLNLAYSYLFNLIL